MHNETPRTGRSISADINGSLGQNENTIFIFPSLPFIMVVREAGGSQSEYLELCDGFKRTPGSHISFNFLTESAGEKYIVADMTEPFSFQCRGISVRGVV